MIEYFNEDCMIGMARYPDKYFDLAIVDPPYGIERFKNGGSHLNKYGSSDRLWNNEKPSQQYFDELFRVSKYQIIWGGNNFALPTSEYFVVWQKNNALDFSFAMCEQAWTNVKKPAKLFTHFHASETAKRIHPTQKPVALYKWLLKNYAKEGDKILDTHVGSASSLIACYDMGFEAVGFELDEDYYNESQKRLERHMRQTSMFDLVKEST